MTRPPLPHVVARIAATQRLARRRQCRHCRAWVLIGPDADDAAGVARVDPTPLDRLHVVAAYLAGTATYDLQRNCLYYREPWHLHSMKYPVLITHTCTGGK